jgi:SAM-dependent methyltransferase
VGFKSTRYFDGTYLEANPTLHVEDSAWKAQQVLKMLNANSLQPSSICEVGCGAGEILTVLSRSLPEVAEFVGYEISPDAYEACEPREHSRLKFVLGDFAEVTDRYFDLVLVMDVVEHIEDVYGFLRSLHGKSDLVILNIPLEFSAYTALRQKVLDNSRRQYGHLHHLNEFTALSTLVDAGFDVIDYFLASQWTNPAQRRIHRPHSFLGRALTFALQVGWSINPRLTAKALGGGSIVVLAKELVGALEG